MGGGVNLCSYPLRHSRSILLAAAIGIAASASAATLSLSTLDTSRRITDGTIVWGTLSANVKLAIADGATVTFDKVTITNGLDNYNYNWAGITCEGSATIILYKGSTIKGFYRNYPGIYVPAGSTLTIKESPDKGGSLNASSNGRAAGIGGGWELPCGNIVIESGIITATGGSHAAGIGGGDESACGNITISGGDITATGDTGGAGVGGGYEGACGNITISGGDITATGDGGAGIGGGQNAVCGSIRISGGVVAAAGSSGAGIGCGSTGGGGFSSTNVYCGAITISGGDITATGRDGAGIGSGFGAGCGSITIYGGEVGVSSGTYSSCIGGGRRGSCDSVAIGSGISSVVLDGVNSIGAGQLGECGAIILHGDLSDEVSGSTRTITSKLVNLADVTENTTITDGKIITGTLAANVKVSIADGATVTLRDATINGGTGDWAGLTCLGNATIILEGSNAIKGFNNYYAGISIDDGTLTIKGDGSLDARGSGWAAGIGGNRAKACGNIVIEGGTITATGGSQSPGIGSGALGSCGDITITKGVTSVTATMGSGGWYSIGSGKNGTCGTVTIGGEEGEIEESPYTYYGNGTGGVTELPAPAFAAGGKAATTEFVRGANGKWTLTTFAEMSNDALGSGVEDGQIKVYAAPTVEGLNNASPMTSGVTVKGKKSAVMTTIEVTPPGNPDSQFFKVKFGE